MIWGCFWKEDLCRHHKQSCSLWSNYFLASLPRRLNVHHSREPTNEASLSGKQEQFSVNLSNYLCTVFYKILKICKRSGAKSYRTNGFLTYN